MTSFFNEDSIILYLHTLHMGYFFWDMQIFGNKTRKQSTLKESGATSFLEQLFVFFTTQLRVP